MTHEPEFSTVQVAGGDMTVARWGDGPTLVLGVHGITASSVMFTPLARHLGPEFTLVAPDLRGRGASWALPGPFGMRAHAADCADVIKACGGGPAIVVGVSMGGFVSDVLAAEYPELVERVLLVDGGLPLELPPDIDPKDFSAALLGPALQRLGMTFPSLEAYFDFWRAHPAVGEDWSADFEAYLAYDLTGDPPELRSRVSGDAIAADLYDHVVDPHVIAESLPKIRGPIHLLQAPRGILNQPEPVQPDSLVEKWRTAVPQLTNEWVEDVNHYTIVLGERGSKTIAERVMA